MRTVPSKTRPFLMLWIWLAAYLNFAGWVLSACHALNRTGYLLALMGFAAVVWRWRDAFGFSSHPTTGWRWKRRFSRPLPAIFFVTTVLVFFGGLFSAPTNYDALTYRLPRILNWLAAGHWCWIPTINDRMNFSGASWEWLAAPVLALFHSDRPLFLINLVQFILLPGLLFSVFRQLGVSGRIAVVWMWLLPLGCGYVMQAGGLGNDLTGAVFCLASVHFGLRARTSGRVSDVWLSLLAAALMTSIKLTNLPLALPCVVAVWPALPCLRRAFRASFAVLFLAIFASALPIMTLNRLNTGSFGGDPDNVHQAQIANPAAGIFGNSLQLFQQSLLPPFFPGAPAWFPWFNEHLLAPGGRQFLQEHFPRYFLGGFSELPGEENAGLGCGLAVTFALVFVASLFRLRWPGHLTWRSVRACVAGSALIAIFFFFCKIGSEATARLLLPYYPLVLIPFLWLPVQERWLRSSVWRVWLVLVGLSVLPAVILSPARPLWPAQSLSQAWLENHPGSKFAQRIATTYATYANRNDLLRPIREQIPGEADCIALAAGSNDAEYSLWRPFGTRAVRCLWTSRDRHEPAVPPGIEWLVVHVKEWNYLSSVPLSEWAARHHARIIATIPIVTFAKHGADDWCLLRLEKRADVGVIHPED